MSNRPSWDQYFLEIAQIVSTRSTCLRRAVGCVLVDKQHKILATGYNGVIAGQPHCNESSEIKRVSLEVEHVHPYACEGAQADSGTQLDKCEAVHAEQNALLQCNDVSKIHTAYCTTAPCITCTKLLLSTGCRSIVFSSRYSIEHDQVCRDLCNRNGMEWAGLI